jgi:YidC/Oxa1 family membrane protein insertase
LWQAIVHWFSELIQFMYEITVFLGVPNYGFAIILITILIKIALFPLTQKQMKSMRGMQEIQPEVKYIQEKFKDEPEIMQKKMMELYKEKGVSPFGGCLPLLIQMPIFIAFYQSLIKFEFKVVEHASFFGIDKMLKAGELGDIYKEGISVAICGKPNVGKSSLLNALLGKERAIVTDVPGTTRDLIEEYVNIRGIPVRIIDTAGIRDTSDLVEKLGINRAKQAIKDADLIILVLDVEAGMTEEDIRIFQELENKERIILLVNKDDLLEKKIKKEDIELHFSGIDVIWASIKEDIGIQSLAEMIERKVMAGLADGEQLEFTVSLRQKELLKEAG